MVSLFTTNVRVDLNLPAISREDFCSNGLFPSANQRAREQFLSVRALQRNSDVPEARSAEGILYFKLVQGLLIGFISNRRKTVK